MLEYLLNLGDLAVKCDMILTSRALGASASLRELLQRGFSRALGVSAPLQEMSGNAGCVVAIQEGRGAGHARGTVLTLWRD